MKARLSTVQSRSVSASSGGVPHRIGSPVQGREGRAEALGGRVPGARRISPASQSEPAGIPSVGATLVVAILTGMPQPRAGRPAWSRQTSTPVRRRREATAREKPEKLIQGRRRTPRANLSAPFENRRGRSTAHRSAAERGMLSPLPCPRSGDAGRVWTTDASGLKPALRSI